MHYSLSQLVRFYGGVLATNKKGSIIATTANTKLHTFQKTSRGFWKTIKTGDLPHEIEDRKTAVLICQQAIAEIEGAGI